MSRWNEISDLRTLREYARGMLARAHCHAPSVDRIAPLIAMEVLGRADRIWVMTNIGSFQVGRRTFVVRYDRHGRPPCVEVREGSLQGRVLARWTNATPSAEILAFFDRIAPLECPLCHREVRAAA